MTWSVKYHIENNYFTMNFKIIIKMPDIDTFNATFNI